MPIVHGLENQRIAVGQVIYDTWKEPSDVLSILLIIGGDVVLKTLAQLSGRTIVPVAFSFGWVAYSFNTLMAVVGDGRLMPPPDYPARVVNSSSGFTRDSRSWVIGRLLRDFRVQHPLTDEIGLSVMVFQAMDHTMASIPSIDWCWASGLVTIGLQLAIASIPCGLSGDWGILLVTASGTALALATGALPQWKFEKWACRTRTKKVVAVTGGTGTRHVMVIIGKGEGLDLEDLAAAESPRLKQRGVNIQGPLVYGLPLAFRVTQTLCLLLAILWLLLLITVTSIKQNTWYLLAVGGLGMIHNVVVAGACRKLGTSGIHIKKIERIEGEKVMDTIMDLEEAYPTVGRSLLSEFFPRSEGLRDIEKSWWEGDKRGYESMRETRRPTSLKYRRLPSELALLTRHEHRVQIGLQPMS